MVIKTLPCTATVCKLTAMMLMSPGAVVNGATGSGGDGGLSHAQIEQRVKEINESDDKVGKLGSGNYASVYSLGDDNVVKVLDNTKVHFTIREYLYLKNLEHRNIVQLRSGGLYLPKIGAVTPGGSAGEAGADDAGPPAMPCFLVMEKGETSLHDRMYKRNASDYTGYYEAFESSEIRGWIRDILKGLAYMAPAGLAHRDLKPENILLFDETAKICDFGLAKVLNTTATTERIIYYKGQRKRGRRNSVCGTPCYHSPEILTEEDYTTLSDVWQVGCILGELLIRNLNIKYGEQMSYNSKVTELSRTPLFTPDAAAIKEQLDILLNGREFESFDDEGKKWLNRRARITASRLEATNALKGKKRKTRKRNLQNLIIKASSAVGLSRYQIGKYIKDSSEVFDLLADLLTFEAHEQNEHGEKRKSAAEQLRHPYLDVAGDADTEIEVCDQAQIKTLKGIETFLEKTYEKQFGSRDREAMTPADAVALLQAAMAYDGPQPDGKRRRRLPALVALLS